MKLDALPPLVAVAILAAFSIPKRSYARAETSELTDHGSAWVSIFSPEGITVVALQKEFIEQHLSGEPFNWQALDAAQVKSSLSDVHQVSLLCGADLTTHES